MRVLIITMSLPYPPASGGALRVHGILEGLYQAGHDVTVLCFHDDHSSLIPEYIRIETVPYIPRSTSTRLRQLITQNQPDLVGRFYRDEFATRLRALLAAQDFDLVQFEGIESVCYLPDVQQAQPQAKLCFDTFNAEYDLQRNIAQIDAKDVSRWPAALYSRIQSGRIYHFEGEMCRRSDVVIAVSPEDADLLRDFRDDRCIHVIPNGIWVDRYQPASQQNIPAALHDIDNTTPLLVFTGKMDYRPNVDAMLWFTDAVLPLVKAQIPDARLFIVGQQPSPRLDALRQRREITITGWVDSVIPYLQAADVYIAPLRMGSGTRLKLLEAMAAGCEIVATQTASAGLLPEIKANMHITDDPIAFATKIIDLLQHPTEFRDNLREQVRQYYDWSTLIPRLLNAYQHIGLE